jgi:hypothetical protein
VEWKLGARREGFVEDANATGGQDQNALVLLKSTEEDRYKSVVIKSCDSALLQKYPCPIKQHYTAPDLTEVKVKLQILLHLFGLRTNVTTGYSVQWLLSHLSDTLRCEGFPVPGPP